jgi:hypothetical protein
MKKLKLSPGRIILGAIGLAIGIVAVLALREATLSTHEPVTNADEMELVVHARMRNGEPTQTLTEMVEAQLQTCRLEVTSDLVGPVESLGDGQFRAVLAPAMDETNRRQFKGCVEDWTIDQVLLGVVSLDPRS